MEGDISLADKKDHRSRAIRNLDKIKHDPREEIKVSVKINHFTTILVHPKKLKRIDPMKYLERKIKIER